jgi:hypothetical protein
MIKCCGFWSLVKCEFLDTDFSLAILPATSRLLAMADKQVICLVVCNQALATSTGWGTASSITGSTSAATATVTALINIIIVISYLGWLFLDEWLV